MGNAINFTDIGEVSIIGSSANGSFNVAVRDTAPGISAVDQAKLFQEQTKNEQNSEKSEMRVMWIMTAVIVLVIIGMVGINMLTHPDWMHGG